MRTNEFVPGRRSFSSTRRWSTKGRASSRGWCAPSRTSLRMMDLPIFRRRLVSTLPNDMRDRLIIALDVDSGDRALELARQLGHVAGGFKVGSRLFTLEGPSIVRRLVDLGARVFLDLKWHDIPNQVAQSVE